MPLCAPAIRNVVRSSSLSASYGWEDRKRVAIMELISCLCMKAVDEDEGRLLLAYAKLPDDMTDDSAVGILPLLLVEPSFPERGKELHRYAHGLRYHIFLHDDKDPYQTRTHISQEPDDVITRNRPVAEKDQSASSLKISHDRRDEIREIISPDIHPSLKKKRSQFGHDEVKELDLNETLMTDIGAFFFVIGNSAPERCIRAFSAHSGAYQPGHRCGEGKDRAFAYNSAVKVINGAAVEEYCADLFLYVFSRDVELFDEQLLKG